MGFKVLPTAANYIHVAFGENKSLIHSVLTEKVLYRQEFDHPCLRGFSRFTAGPQESMNQVIDVIKQVLKNKL